MPSPQATTTPADTAAAYQRYLVPPKLVEDGWVTLGAPPAAIRYFSAERLSAPAQEAKTHAAMQLQQDARGYFDCHAVVRRPLPPLDDPADVAHVLRTLLMTFNGCVFGEESHTSAMSKDLLTEHMPLFHSLGVRTLYLEGMIIELHQDELDRYNAAPDADAPLPTGVRDHLLLQDAADFQHQSVMGTLYQTAHRYGIRIMALDCIPIHDTPLANAAPSAAELEEVAPWRTATFNYFAAQVIQHQQGTANEGKWLALVGAAHVGHHLGSPGLAELTQAVGITIGIHPSPVQAYCTLHPGQPGSPGPIQADLRILHRPRTNVDTSAPQPGHQQLDFDSKAQVALSDVEQTLRSETGNYVIRALADENRYALYYHDKNGKIVRMPIEHSIQDGRESFVIREADWFAQQAKPFNSLPALRAALNRSLFDVWPHLTPRFTPPEAWPSAMDDASSQREHLDTQSLQEDFTWSVRSTLTQLAWFATDAKRTEFKQGKNAKPETAAAWFPQGALEHSQDIDLARLWLNSDSPLSLQQKGALLAQLERNRQQRSAQLATRWRTVMEQLGSEHPLLFSQNRYMAAFDARRPGYCRAFSTHLMALAMQDGRAAVARYVAHFDRALMYPQADAARLLDLGVLHWSLNSAQQRFGRTQALSLPDIAGVMPTLLASQAPTAFELRLGSHVIGIAITVHDEQRCYGLADPNFGYAEFVTLQNVQRALAEHLRLLMASRLIPADVSSPLVLQQYRADLAQQPLLPGKHLRLTLADLGQQQDLAQCAARSRPLAQNHSLLKLQQKLLQEELRAQWRLERAGMDADRLLNAQLEEVFARQGAPGYARGPTVLQRLERIEFRNGRAWVSMRTSGASSPQRFAIKGDRHPDDMRVLGCFSLLLERRPRILRLLLSCVRGAPPQVDLEQLALTLALPEDQASSEQLLALLAAARA